MAEVVAPSSQHRVNAAQQVGERSMLVTAGERSDRTLPITLTTSISGIALQELIEAELSAKISAEPGERTSFRLAQRNGHRPKLLATFRGELVSAISAQTRTIVFTMAGSLVALGGLALALTRLG